MRSISREDACDVTFGIQPKSSSVLTSPLQGYIRGCGSCIRARSIGSDVRKALTIASFAQSHRKLTNWFRIPVLPGSAIIVSFVPRCGCYSHHVVES